MSSFTDIMKQAESLLRQASNSSEDQAAELREQAKVLLEQVQDSTKGFTEQATVKAKETAETFAEYVKENPLKAVGLAASLGLLLGSVFKGGSNDADAGETQAKDASNAAPPQLENLSSGKNESAT